MSPRQIKAAAARGERGAASFLRRYERRRRAAARELVRGLERLPARLGLTRDWQAVIETTLSEKARHRAALRIARAWIRAEGAQESAVALLASAIHRAGEQMTSVQKLIAVHVEGRRETYENATAQDVVPLVSLAAYLQRQSRAHARATARAFEQVFGPHEKRGRPADDTDALATKIREAVARVRAHGSKPTQERVSEELSIGTRTLQERVRKTGRSWTDLSRG